MKRKILALCDTPTCSTGFAQVTKNLLKQLYNTGKYDIDIIGVNHHGDPYDYQKFPYYIVPANFGIQGDHAGIMGLRRFQQVVNGADRALKPPFDILFTLNDHFVLEDLSKFVNEVQTKYKKDFPSKAWFKWIAYWPVDSEIKENWAEAILRADYPVMYTDYGVKQVEHWSAKREGSKSYKKIKKGLKKLRQIPHGVETDDFFPVGLAKRKKFREEYFKGEVDENTFLVTNISRNQPRKDIMRTLMAFKKFHKRVPDSKLYLHMKNQDVGGSILEMGRFLELKDDSFVIPKSFDENQGVSIETLNMIYNVSDVCFTTTLGEGWGFINTESMAAKTPIVAPDNTSITEIFGGSSDLFDKDWTKFRGIPVRCGTTNSEWFCLGLSDQERIRPLTNVDDACKKLLWVYHNKDKVKQIVDNAYEWVQELTWDKVCREWVYLFDKAYKDLNLERSEK